MAMLLTPDRMAVFLTERPSRRPLFSGSTHPRRLCIGAAMLTKELAFTVVLTVLIFGLWEYWRTRRISASAPALVTVGVAVLTYSVYWFWILGTSVAALMAQHGGTLSYTILAHWITGSETPSGFLASSCSAPASDGRGQDLVGIGAGVSLPDFLIPA